MDEFGLIPVARLIFLQCIILHCIALHYQSRGSLVVVVAVAVVAVVVAALGCVEWRFSRSSAHSIVLRSAIGEVHSSSSSRRGSLFMANLTDSTNEIGIGIGKATQRLKCALLCLAANRVVAVVVVVVVVAPTSLSQHTHICAVKNCTCALVHAQNLRELARTT